MKSLQSRSTTSVLKKLLEDPNLPEKIQAMPAHELAQMIHAVGLEDSGEIVAFASTEQLELVFDEDLWKSERAGDDEAFDASRFGLWLEILLELGSRNAAQKISEMDEDFLKMAFSNLAWVADLDWLRDDCELNPRVEKAMDSSLSHELGNFILFSRDSNAWDALITILAEMDSHHHSFLYRVLSRCADLLIEQVDNEGGLYEVLSAEDQIMDDVAYEREKRREALGFVTPADARAFLKLSEGSMDIPDNVSPRHLRATKTASAGIEKIDTLPAAPLSAHRFSRVLEVFNRNSAFHQPLTEQINYLANVLMSGWDWKGKQPRPAKAMEIALEVCELGLEKAPTTSSFLEAFRRGWVQWNRNENPTLNKTKGAPKKR